MPSAVRRSARERRPNPKYSVNPFENLDLGDSSDAGEEAAAIAEDDSAEDEEFQINEADQEQINEDDEDDEDNADGLLDDENSAGSVSAEASETGDDESAIGEEPKRRRRIAGIRDVSTLGRKLPGTQTEELHTRGLLEVQKKNSKRQRVMLTFGIEGEDILPAMRAKDKWYDEATLPSQKSGRSAKGGMGYSFFYTPEMRSRESTNAWNWYYEQGASRLIHERQHWEDLSEERGVKYLPTTILERRCFLAGPYPNQKQCSLRPGESLNLVEACDWGNPSHDINKNRKRTAWVTNVGHRVNCLEWMPHNAASDQYLALSVLQQDEPGVDDRFSKGLLGNTKAPAFTPSGPSAASIELWAFAVSAEKGPGTGSLASDKAPMRALVICTDWGPVKQLRWCPVPPSASANDERPENKQCRLLAGVWGDGKIRVLDLSLIDMSRQSVTRYIHVDSAAFEFEPVNTVYTCITWLSATDIAAGCANGCVTIWNLSNANRTPTGRKPRPWLDLSLHPTYVLAIASAYPSRPCLLATTGMDGHLRLTDLRAPTTDCAFSPRARLGHSALAWLDHIQCFMTADDTLTVRAHPVRRLMRTVALGRFTGFVLAIATSPAHPFFMVATADGMALSSNPVRRLLEVKASLWQQLWFLHEWRRAQPSQSAARASNEDGQQGQSVDKEAQGNDDASPQLASKANPEVLNGGPSSTVDNDTNAPLCRFTEGYKPTRPCMLSGERSNDAGVVVATIHEAQTAVTAVSWNPNFSCGGWAAAGLCSGLLRVEDLATYV